MQRMGRQTLVVSWCTYLLWIKECWNRPSEGSGWRTRAVEALICSTEEEKMFCWRSLHLLLLVCISLSVHTCASVCVHTVLIWQDDGLFRAVPASCPSWRLKDPGFFQHLLKRLARPCIDMGLEYLKQLQGNMQTKGRKCNFVLKWLYKSGSRWSMTAVLRYIFLCVLSFKYLCHGTEWIMLHTNTYCTSAPAHPAP